MSNAQTSNLKHLVQIERLRRVRTWLLGLGMVVILFSLTFVGGSGASPKWWGNTFAALRDQGFLLWLVLPGVGIGLLLLAACCSSSCDTFSSQKGKGSLMTADASNSAGGATAEAVLSI